MNYILFLTLTLFIHSSGYAKSLGVLGQTFPVMEKSLLVLIYERLQGMQKEGQWHDLERQWKSKVESQVLRPSPLHLTRAQKKKMYRYIPEATASQDIRDPYGRIIITKGTRVNALTAMPDYNPVWLFINFDDQAQRDFAKNILSQYSDVELILTGGNVAEAEQQMSQTIYFDQEARITQKLHIEHVPALVTRSHDSLHIVEYVIGENGHAL